MKFGLNTNSLKKFYSIPELAAKAREIGLDGMEWGLPGTIEEVRQQAPQMIQAAKNEGLESFSFINAPSCWKIEQVEQWSEVAAECGVHLMRVAHPWYAWDYAESTHQPDSFNDLVKMTTDALAKLEPISEKYGVRYVLETHCGSTFTSPMAVEYLKPFSPKHTGFIYDPSNTIIEGFIRPRGAMELMGDYVAYLHIKGIRFVRKDGKWCHEKCSIMDGMLNYEELAFALKFAKFDGYCSFEEMYSGPENVVTEVKDALAYFKDCMAKAPADKSEPYIMFNR